MELQFPIPKGYGWQYHFLLWLQSFHSQWLDKAMIGVTNFGRDYFYIWTFFIILWSVNRVVGLRLSYIFIASIYTNAWLKDALVTMRPIGIPGIRSIALDTGTGFATPSGHAQASMVGFVLVGKWIKQWWFWVLTAIIVFAVGISRMYLGLHWPLDVVGGWGLGFIIGIVGWILGRWWTYRKYSYSLRMWLAVLIPVVLLLIHSGETSFHYACILLGFGVGAVLQERHFGLHIEQAPWKRVCCGIIGIAGLIALQWLEQWVMGWPLLLDVKNVLLGLWGSLGAPYVFYRCGLHTKEITE